MNSNRIWITGGSGVLGRRVVGHLLTQHRVLCLGTDLSRFPEEIRHHANFKFYQCDLRSFSTANLPKEGILLFLHMAGVVADSKAPPEDSFLVNGKATKELLDWIKKKGNIPFLFLSSVSVYGNQEKPASIETNPEGSSLYARSKREGEEAVLSYTGPKSIFRMASLYGEGTKSFIAKLSRLHRMRIWPRFRSPRKKSFLSVEDASASVVFWVNRVMAKKKLEPIYILAETKHWDLDSLRFLFPPRFLFLVPLEGILGKLLLLVLPQAYHSLGMHLEVVPNWEKLGFFPKKALEDERKSFNLP